MSSRTSVCSDAPQRPWRQAAGAGQPPGALVDAMTIFTVPVVLGGGKKLFADGHYERDGEIKIGGTPLDSPSEPEIARQERMKREG